MVNFKGSCLIPVWDVSTRMTKPGEELDIFNGVGQTYYRQQSEAKAGWYSIHRVRVRWQFRQVIPT